MFCFVKILASVVHFTHVTDYNIVKKMFELFIFSDGYLQEGTMVQVPLLMRDISDIWIICKSF